MIRGQRSLGGRIHIFLRRNTKMQCLEVGTTDNEKPQMKKRHRPRLLPLLVGVLFVFGFVGGFINGYSFGIDDNQRNKLLSSIYLHLPQAASAETAHTDVCNTFTPVLRASLSNSEYIVYDALVDSVSQFSPQSSFSLPSPTTVSMERIVEITKIVLNEPELYWLESISWITWTDNQDGTRTYTVKIDYNMDAEERCSTQKAIEAVVGPILEEADCHSAKEAAEYVNNYLASSVSYMRDKVHQTEHPYDMITGPLLTKQAICSGYAKTFTYLMARLGYPSAYCLGYTKEGVYHAWNAIRDGDTILYTDSTFNASDPFDERWLNLSRDDFDSHQETQKFWYEPTI